MMIGKDLKRQNDWAREKKNELCVKIMDLPKRNAKNNSHNYTNP